MTLCLIRNARISFFGGEGGSVKKRDQKIIFTVKFMVQTEANSPKCFIFINFISFYLHVLLLTRKVCVLVCLNISIHLIFVWPCIIDTNNIDNQPDATITVY